MAPGLGLDQEGTSRREEAEAEEERHLPKEEEGLHHHHREGQEVTHPQGQALAQDLNNLRHRSSRGSSPSSRSSSSRHNKNIVTLLRDKCHAGIRPALPQLRT